MGEPAFLSEEVDCLLFTVLTLDCKLEKKDPLRCRIEIGELQPMLRVAFVLNCTAFTRQSLVNLMSQLSGYLTGGKF